MARQHTLDISEIVEHQNLSRFLVRLIVLSWIVTFLDAFDMNVVAFAGPSIAPYFHLSRVMMGNVFGFGLFGQVFGAFIFGYLGDTLGRRRAIIIASAWFALSTLLVGLAHGYGFLLTVRFLQGIGVGGFLPLIWALNIEYAPKHYRSTLVILNTVGYSAGVIIGGPIALYMIPRFGWQSVFLVGGGIDILATLALAAMLPESIRFLVSKRLRPDVVAKIVERIVPGSTTPETQFVLSDEGGQGRKKFTPNLLFVGALRWITPFLWISYFCCKLTTFFVTTWTPMFFQAMQFAPADAAWAVTVCQLGGLLVALLLMRFVDNYGAIAITVMPVLEIPIMLIAGLFAFGHATFFVLYALVVTFQLSGQQAMNGIIGVYYPSAYRSNGTAWASAIANVGAALGPIVGGFILASNLQTRNVLAVLAVFPAVVAVFVFIIGRMHTRILGREAMEAPTEPAFAQGSATK